MRTNWIPLFHHNKAGDNKTFLLGSSSACIVELLVISCASGNQVLPLSALLVFDMFLALSLQLQHAEKQSSSRSENMLAQPSFQ